MKLRRNEMDTNTSLRTRISVYASGFQMLLKEPDGQDIVEQYRKQAEQAIHKLDQGMVGIMDDDNDMILWASQMKSCIQMLYALDRNLVFKGKPQWNWAEVIGAMAFLEAIIKGAKNTLGENEKMETVPR